MEPKWFELGMLLCFGASWPFAVVKTWRSKTAAGKSFLFLWLVFVGYISGTMFKITSGIDWVLLLYLSNGLLVAMDIALSYRYRRRGLRVAAEALESQ